MVPGSFQGSAAAQLSWLLIGSLSDALMCPYSSQNANPSLLGLLPTTGPQCIPHESE